VNKTQGGGQSKEVKHSLFYNSPISPNREPSISRMLFFCAKARAAGVNVEFVTTPALGTAFDVLIRVRLKAPPYSLYLWR
jgi:hypothetical protein